MKYCSNCVEGKVFGSYPSNENERAGVDVR